MRLLIDISNYNIEWIRNAYDIPRDIGTDIAKAIIDGHERKTGHWIDGKCSECGEHAPYYSMATAYYLSKFCPHCGAEMSHDD